MKSWIEKHYQGVNIKVWKDMRMNNILEKNFFCPWLIVTLVKEVFEQFTVGGTALRLSKFDIADLVLAIFWSRFWIILFFCSWHDYERTHSCHQSHQGVIRESSDINYTLIMFYDQHCVGRASLSFSKFHSCCLIYLWVAYLLRGSPPEIWPQMPKWGSSKYYCSHCLEGKNIHGSPGSANLSGKIQSTVY